MMRSPLLSPASPPVGLAAFLISTSYYIPFIIHPSIEIDRPCKASALNLSSTTVRRPFAKPAIVQASMIESAYIDYEVKTRIYGHKEKNEWSPRSSDQFTSCPLLAVSSTLLCYISM